MNSLLASITALLANVSSITGLMLASLLPVDDNITAACNPLGDLIFNVFESVCRIAAVCATKTGLIKSIDDTGHDGGIDEMEQVGDVCTSCVCRHSIKCHEQRRLLAKLTFKIKRKRHGRNGRGSWDLTGRGEISSTSACSSVSSSFPASSFSEARALLARVPRSDESMAASCANLHVYSQYT